MRDQWMRVEGEQHLYKDPYTNGVIDTDTVAYNKYLEQKRQKQQQANRIEGMESRINNIESDLSDIKLLLTRLLETTNGNNN